MRRCKGVPFKDVVMLLKATACGPRWAIIKALSSGELSTNEIAKKLEEVFGRPFPKSTLYYHLSVLRDIGIIDLASYRERGPGAPEKIWKLKTRKIVVDLLDGKVSFE